MSVLFENDLGTFISVEKFINNTVHGKLNISIKSSLFKIISPYSRRTVTNKMKKSPLKVPNVESTSSNLLQEVLFVEKKYLELLKTLRTHELLVAHSSKLEKNTEALKTSEYVYEESGKEIIENILGSNIGPPTVRTLQNSKFLFPENCRFFCKDVSDISTHLQHEVFDLILLDPPWWNKYIRRKRKKCPHAYNMMFDCDLKKIPVETLLNNNGIVVVWCTNSQQHLKCLIDEIFIKWKVRLVAKWYWMKVTMHGEPICEFSQPPGKQPFEQIIIGYREENSTNLPQNGKLIVSIPSAIHSHKPPLVEILQPFLPNNPKCLELFARYLLPNWTSYGNEVLRFQHESLYNMETIK